MEVIFAFPNRQNERDFFIETRQNHLRQLLKQISKNITNCSIFPKEISRRAAYLSDYEEVEKEPNGILEKYGLSLPYSPQSKEILKDTVHFVFHDL